MIQMSEMTVTIVMIQGPLAFQGFEGVPDLWDIQGDLVDQGDQGGQMDQGDQGGQVDQGTLVLQLELIL